MRSNGLSFLFNRKLQMRSHIISEIFSLNTKLQMRSHMSSHVDLI